MGTAEDAALKKGQEMAKNLPSPAVYLRPADLLVADVTALSPIYVSQGKGTIKSVKIVPGASVSSSNATLTLYRYRNGSGSTVKATTASGWTSAMEPISLSSLSNTALQEGDVLGVAVTKSGGGVLLPALLVLVAIEAG